MARQQDDFIKTSLRLPPDIHALLHAATEETGRTFNSEIVERLRASFDAPNPLDARLTAIEREVAELKKRKS